VSRWAGVDVGRGWRLEGWESGDTGAGGKRNRKDAQARGGRSAVDHRMRIRRCVRPPAQGFSCGSSIAARPSTDGDWLKHSLRLQTFQSPACLTLSGSSPVARVAIASPPADWTEPKDCCCCRYAGGASPWRRLPWRREPPKHPLRHLLAVVEGNIPSRAACRRASSANATSDRFQPWAIRLLVSRSPEL
jgi:hypothetical protein